jgi:hypothetical protein
MHRSGEGRSPEIPFTVLTKREHYEKIIVIFIRVTMAERDIAIPCR